MFPTLKIGPWEHRPHLLKNSRTVNWSCYMEKWEKNNKERVKRPQVGFYVGGLPSQSDIYSLKNIWLSTRNEKRGSKDKCRKLKQQPHLKNRKRNKKWRKELEVVAREVEVSENGESWKVRKK